MATATTKPDHLIIVACHAIWLGGQSRGLEESEWLIWPFQNGEVATFVEHARAGVATLAEDLEKGLLIFSGGPTRAQTRLSEAQSYLNLTIANEYFGLLPGAAATTQPQASHPPRIAAEERALDSYTNVLYSLMLFWHLTDGNWPTRITVVSHAFKKTRIQNLHLNQALQVPLSQITYIGIDPPQLAQDEAKLAETLAGEERAVAEWTADPHGVGDGLRGKRVRRNVCGVPMSLGLSKGEGEKAGLQMERVEGRDVGEEKLVDGAMQPWVQEFERAVVATAAVSGAGG